MINVVLPTGSYFFEFKTDVTKYRPNLFFIEKPVFTKLFGRYFTFLGKNVTFVENNCQAIALFFGRKLHPEEAFLHNPDEHPGH